VAVDGEPIRLTRREFELLRYLVANRNRVLSRDRLLERVWGYDQAIETRSVDVHVGRLRGKTQSGGSADRNGRWSGIPVRRITQASFQPLSSSVARFERECLLRAFDTMPVHIVSGANYLAILFVPYFPPGVCC
jgi:hypothetical protein